MLKCRTMASELTKTQADRLGDRLKKGNITEADLRLLDAYRRSFTEAYEIVVGAIRRELALEPTGRPAKSTISISDKLRRESIRLTQIQDIAGCRLTVSDIFKQDEVVQSLSKLFENVTIVDRRQKPSHGYRAVHVIVQHSGKLIEIQVRTELQHLWAELSEKFSDIIDPAIKYGGGDEGFRLLLIEASLMVTKYELLEERLVKAQVHQGSLTDNKKRKIAQVQESSILLRKDILKVLRTILENVEKLKGENDDLSD